MMVEVPYQPSIIPVGSDRRVAIPQGFYNRLHGVDRDAPSLLWLLLLRPGRFRILANADVEKDPRLSNIRSELINGPGEIESSCTEFEENDRAALVGRLTPTQLAGPKPAWRLVVPKALMPDDVKTIVLLYSSGYLELWFHAVYLEALSRPLDAVL